MYVIRGVEVPHFLNGMTMGDSYFSKFFPVNAYLFYKENKPIQVM